MNVSGVLGLALLALAICPAILIGGTGLIFVNPPSLIICVWVTTALGIMSFGLKDFVRGTWVLRVLLVKVPRENLCSCGPAVLRGLIVHMYASALIGSLIGMVQMLANLEDPAQIGGGLAIMLICPFYAVLLSEGLFRTTLRHIEHNFIREANS